MALLDFIYQAFIKICETASHIFDFLFTTVNIPNVGEIAIWQMLTGATLVIAITYLIIRKFTV